MRRFLRRRWHGIPLGLLLTLVLVVGAAAGSFTFWSGTANVTVVEAITLQMWDGAAWVSLPETLTFSMSPGDTLIVPFKGSNAGTVNLAVTLITTMTSHPPDGWGKVEFVGGFVDGRTLTPGAPAQVHNVQLRATKDAPSGTYTFAVNFTRG